MTVAIPVEAPAPIKEKSVADVLRNAARIMEERGGDGTGYCAWVAICEAADDETDSFAAERAATKTLLSHLGVVPQGFASDVFVWNDAQPDDATRIAALRAAAEAAS